MKKLTTALCCIVFLSTSAFPFQLGLEFSAGSDMIMGANMRFNQLFELKPQLGFSFSENNNRLRLLVNSNFYLPEISDLQHYAGLGLDLDVQSGNNNGGFGLDGHYGLRYNITEIISLFGEIGFFMDFDPFYMSSFRGGAGITIFFPNFESYGPTASSGSSGSSSSGGSYNSGSYDSGSGSGSYDSGSGSGSGSYDSSGSSGY
jgi:hypothetical protein